MSATNMLIRYWQSSAFASLAFGQDKTGSIGGVPEWIYSGVDSLSPNGRPGGWQPVRGENDAELPPNLLVCLAPYPDQDWYGGRAMGGRVTSRWPSGMAFSGRDLGRAKVGTQDLAVYEIEKDAIKRIQPV